MTWNCPVCAECKPYFYRPDKVHLIKATRPFERLSVDFKGPLPSTDRNVYFLNVVDEYSRFPFAIPCPDMTSATVIKVLHHLFTLFGYPCYIHSDRRSSFMSDELRQYLVTRGIASNRTTSYNPRGNGQVERENTTVWKAVLLALKSKGLPVSRWQEVLPDALHSIRSLLCTATNATPHERLFAFPRRSASGTSLPTWLTTPGPVLLRKHIRAHKSDPLVETVSLRHANPQYAYVVFRDGREDTVSIRDLAPAGSHEPVLIPTSFPPVAARDTLSAPEDGTPGPSATPAPLLAPGGSPASSPDPAPSTSPAPPASPTPSTSPASPSSGGGSTPVPVLRRSGWRRRPPVRLTL